MENKIEIWIDGGSSGNPGPAAVAFLIQKDNFCVVKGYTIGKATNNEAEYKALYEAIFYLESMKDLDKDLINSNCDIVVYTDSMLLMQQIKGNWQIREERLLKYALEILNIAAKYKSFEIRYIPTNKNKVDQIIKLILYS
jgi:ribonuclease HI